jgi:hypothetical protein
VADRSLSQEMRTKGICMWSAEHGSKSVNLSYTSLLDRRADSLARIVAGACIHSALIMVALATRAERSLTCISGRSDVNAGSKSSKWK